MKIVIIGTGNVATVLGKKILEAGHEIMQAAGRSFEKTNLLASQLNCNPVYNTRYLSLSADIYVVAVSDSSIHFVAAQLKLKDKIIVHTAAAVSKNVLETCSENFGVLYPLQTLIKEMPYLPPVPVLIDGNNETTKKVLTEFSLGWAENVQVADDEERLRLHIAAVFVNNFANYIFTIIEEYCKKEQLQFNLLYPLIEETITRLKINPPSGLQTGPAVREDYSTIAKHNEILTNYPELKKFYNLFTQSIISFYNKKDGLNDNLQVSDFKAKDKF